MAAELSDCVRISYWIVEFAFVASGKSSEVEIGFLIDARFGDCFWVELFDCCISMSRFFFFV